MEVFIVLAIMLRRKNKGIDLSNAPNPLFPHSGGFAEAKS